MLAVVVTVTVVAYACCGAVGGGGVATLVRAFLLFFRFFGAIMTAFFHATGRRGEGDVGNE